MSQFKCAGCIPVAAFLVCILVVGASADEIITFGFTDLVFEYDAESRSFHLQERSRSPVSTEGDVTRVPDPNAGDTAVFNFSFPADSLGGVDFDLTLEERVNNVIPASGTLVLTDLDGDQVVAEAEGIFRVNFTGEVQFESIVTNVVLPDNPFNGILDSSIDISAGSFGGGPFAGSLFALRLLAGSNDLSMFDHDILDGTVRNLDGGITPEPASLTLLCCAGLWCLRRRKHFRDTDC